MCRVRLAAGGPVTLRYVVDLSFTREPWPPGNEQAGQFTGDAVYRVTRPVFTVPVIDGPKWDHNPVSSRCRRRRWRPAPAQCSSSPRMTVTACPPSSTRSPRSRTRTMPPRADA